MKTVVPFLLSLVLSISLYCQTSERSSLKDYVGVYVFPEGSVVPEVEVVLADSVLTMNSVAGSSVINQMGADTFYIVQFDGIAIFLRNENHEVIKVHIEAQGYILDGEKKPGSGISFYMRKNDMDLVRIQIQQVYPE